MLNSKSNNIGNDGPVNTTFSLGSYNANAYKQFRPDYAPSLFNHILQYVKKSNTATQNTLAVDVGCGTGQATLALSPFFTNVIGLDPSAPMLSSASSSTSETHNNVSFAVGTCSAFPASISPASCTLVTAAQAAHWFDLPAFYNEAYRVLVPGGCIALFGYGYARVQGFNDISDRIERLGRFDLKAYWDERRGLVDEHYVDPSFTPPNPLFTDVSRTVFDSPGLTHISKQMTRAALLAYLKTWSSYKTWMDSVGGEQEHQQDPVDDFMVPFVEAGTSDDLITVEWPCFLWMMRKRIQA